MSESFDHLMYSFVWDDVISGLFISVPPGHVAAVYDHGAGILKKLYAPGLHLKIPFWQRAKLFNVQTLEYGISQEFDQGNVKAFGDQALLVTSADKKRLLLEATILMRLEVAQIPNLWQSLGDDFVPKIIRPAIRSRFKMIAAKHLSEEILTLNRDLVEIQIKKELDRILYSRGIIIENVLLTEVKPA